MERAGGDNRLPRVEPDGPPVAHRLDAARAPIFHEDAGHQGLGMNSEIAPATRCRVEIADRRGNAATVLVRERNGIAAVGIAAVHIVRKRQAVLLHGGERRAAEPAPLVRKQAADGNTPGAAMAIAGEIDIPLQLVEVRQEALVGPAGEPHFLPLVVVALHPAHGELTVDRRAAAHDAGLLEAAQLRGRVDLGRAIVDAQVLPVKARIEVRKPRIAVEDDVGHTLGWRVGPRFEKGHTLRGVGGKAVGQHGACRSATHDHVVERFCHMPHSVNTLEARPASPRDGPRYRASVAFGVRRQARSWQVFHGSTICRGHRCRHHRNRRRVFFETRGP